MERETPARTAKAVFDRAHEIRSPAERKAFLDQACASAPELRQKVEALLKAYEDAGSSFLEKPAFPPAETAPFQPANDTPASSASVLTVDPETRTTHPVGNEGPGTQIGPYRLIEELGAGGMGAVYLAEQEQPIRRQVALKIIKPGMDSDGIVARFEAERQALTMMEHPNIARVFDAGATASGRPYFVMELVRGVPMTRFCDESQLTLRQRLQLFETVCEALQHAHTKGVIHRDIKPGNVLISLQDGRPVPKVIDFGLAKAMKATEQPLTEQLHLTQVGAIVGTLQYMSPEQADPEGEAADTRTDIYSAGVMLYELLTGTTPLERSTLRGAKVLDVAKRINKDETPPPSARASGLGKRLASIAAERKTEPARLVKLLRGELDWITLKALKKDRQHRYETASDFAKDVQRYLDDEPVEACPPPVRSRYRLRKFVRKHRTLLGVAASFVAFLVLGVVGLTVGIVKIDEARRAAEEAEKRTRKAFDLTWAGIRVQVRKGTRLGESEKAILRNMLAGYKALAVEDGLGTSREMRATAGETAFRLAGLSALLGSEADAEADYRKAMALYEALAHEFPGEAEYRNELARCYFDLAGLLIQKGKRTDAAAAYRRAIELFGKVAADFPGAAAYRGELANAFNDLGALLRDGQELAKAEKAFREAVALREKAVADEPGRLQYRINLAAGYHNLGNAVRDQGHAEAALAWYGKAVALLNPIHPRPPDAAIFLRNVCWDRANALGQLGRHAEASQDWQRAVALEGDGSSRGALQLFLATAQMEVKLTAQGQPAPGLLYAAAVIHARATAAARAVDEPGLEKQYGQRTLALLKQARAAGWFRESQRVQQLKEDRAFAALPAADFQAFLAILGAATGMNDPPEKR